MSVSSSANEWPQERNGTWRHWLSFLGQVLLVVGVGSADDIFHGLIGQSNVQVALGDATKVVNFETAHDLWIEPAIQSFFTHAHDIFGMVVGYAQMVPIFNTIYGLGHVGVTFAFALWMFLYRRPLFAFVRNIFLLTNALAVMIYEIFPLAPPRLAAGLHWDGHPYHFFDTLLGGSSGLKIGFNQFAAMPSLHVAWALIVALTLFMVVRAPVIRLLVLFYPLLMMTTVIVTGNHYIADGLGAAAVLCIAVLVALSLERWRSHERSILGVLRRLQQLRYRRTIEPAVPEAAERSDSQRRSAA